MMVPLKQRTFHADKRYILPGNYRHTCPTNDFFKCLSYKPTTFYQVFFNSLILRDTFCSIITKTPLKFGCNSPFTPI